MADSKSGVVYVQTRTGDTYTHKDCVYQWHDFSKSYLVVAQKDRESMTMGEEVNFRAYPVAAVNYIEQEWVDVSD